MAKGKRASANEISPELVAAIKADIERWHAGKWAAESGLKPACVCGLTDRYIEGNRGYSKHGVPTKECERHKSHERNADT